MRQRVSMEVIAASLGLSKNTVSMILRGMPGFSDETRHRVLAEAARRGYSYHPRTGTPEPTGGLLVLSVIPGGNTAGFFNGLQQGAELEARTNRIPMMYRTCTPEDDPGLLIRDVESMGIRGVLTIGPVAETLVRALLTVAPVVMTDHYHEGLPVDCVLTDNLDGTCLATRHLLKSGRTRLCFTGDIHRSPSFHDRYAGFCKALQWVAQPQRTHLQLFVSLEALWRENPEHAVDAVAMLPEMPDAFVCCNDAEALTLLKILAAMGIRVPEDAAVIGFDDIEPARMVTPELTTLHVDTVKMGRRALRQLMARMADPQAPVEKTLLPVRLTLRQSAP